MEEKRKEWNEQTETISVKDMVDKAIVDNNEDRSREYFFCSDVYQCPRKIWLAFKGIKQEFSPRTLRIFDNGNDVHERILKYFKQAGLYIDDEINIPRDNLNIHGRLDLLYRIGGELRIGEFKSINAKTVYSPKHEHIAQIQLYMHYCKIKKGILVYESKQTQELFVFDVNYDPDKVIEILEWFSELRDNIDTNTMPKVNYSQNKYPCKAGTFICPYYDECYKNEY